MSASARSKKDDSQVLTAFAEALSGIGSAAGEALSAMEDTARDKDRLSIARCAVHAVRKRLDRLEKEQAAEANWWQTVRKILPCVCAAAVMSVPAWFFPPAVAGQYLVLLGVIGGVGVLTAGVVKRVLRRDV